MGLLRYLNDLGEEMFPTDRKSVWKNLYGGYPSEMKRAADKLVVKGWAEKWNTPEGWKMAITENGRKQVLVHLLDHMGPKTGKWDGKWRIVFFDVGDRQRKKRDKLRYLLRRLGFWEMQKSVYINPFDCRQEIEYIKEALNVSAGVKMGVLDQIDEEEELKKIFKIG